jgi:hypothetical protein
MNGTLTRGTGDDRPGRMPEVAMQINQALLNRCLKARNPHVGPNLPDHFVRKCSKVQIRRNQQQAQFRNFEDPSLVQRGLIRGSDICPLLRCSGRRSTQAEWWQIPSRQYSGKAQCCCRRQRRRSRADAFRVAQFSLSRPWRRVGRTSPQIRGRLAGGAPSLPRRCTSVMATSCRRLAVQHRPRSGSATLYYEMKRRIVSNPVRQGGSSSLKLRFGARNHLEVPDGVLLSGHPSKTWAIA